MRQADHDANGGLLHASIRDVEIGQIGRPRRQSDDIMLGGIGDAIDLQAAVAEARRRMASGLQQGSLERLLQNLAAAHDGAVMLRAHRGEHLCEHWGRQRRVDVVSAADEISRRDRFAHTVVDTRRFRRIAKVEGEHAKPTAFRGVDLVGNPLRSPYTLRASPRGATSKRRLLPAPPPRPGDPVPSGPPNLRLSSRTYHAAADASREYRRADDHGEMRADKWIGMRDRCHVVLEAHIAFSARPQKDAGERGESRRIRAIQWIEQPVFPRQCDSHRQLDIEAGSQNAARPLRREGNRLEVLVEDRDPSPLQQLTDDRRKFELPGMQRNHDVGVSRKGNAGPGSKACPVVRIYAGIE
jgi:hypothetical protein